MNLQTFMMKSGCYIKLFLNLPTNIIKKTHRSYLYRTFRISYSWWLTQTEVQEKEQGKGGDLCLSQLLETMILYISIDSTWLKYLTSFYFLSLGRTLASQQMAIGRPGQNEKETSDFSQKPDLAVSMWHQTHCAWDIMYYGIWKHHFPFLNLCVAVSI